MESNVYFFHTKTTNYHISTNFANKTNYKIFIYYPVRNKLRQCEKQNTDNLTLKYTSSSKHPKTPQNSSNHTYINT